MTFKSLINVLGRMREGKLATRSLLLARMYEEMPSGLLATSVTQ